MMTARLCIFQNKDSSQSISLLVEHLMLVDSLFTLLFELNLSLLELKTAVTFWYNLPNIIVRLTSSVQKDGNNFLMLYLLNAKKKNEQTKNVDTEGIKTI